MERAKILLDSIYSGLSKMTDPRVDSFIHVTNLIEFCPREYLICKHNKLYYNDSEKVTANRIITYYVGKAVEGSIIKALETEGVARPIESFKLRVTATDIVTGTPDTAAIIDDGLPYIVELKTTGKDEIDNMEEPYVNHVCQLSLYLWMSELKGYKFHHDVGFVVYVSKLEKKNQIKVFLVRRNDAYIESVRRDLTIVKTFSESGGLPDRICNVPYATMAKRCSTKHLCFEEGK